MSNATFKTFGAPGTLLLDEGLTEALQVFEKVTGRPPAYVAVHPEQVAATRAALDRLKRPAVQVAGQGGVLVGEVWLPIAAGWRMQGPITGVIGAEQQGG